MFHVNNLVMSTTSLHLCLCDVDNHAISCLCHVDNLVMSVCVTLITLQCLFVLCE